MVVPEIAVAVEVGLFVYDTINLIDVLIDPCIPPDVKSRQLGAWMAGAIAPGGGYTAMRTPDRFLVRTADDATAMAGRALPDEHSYQMLAAHADDGATSAARRYQDEVEPYILEKPSLNPNAFCSFTPDTLVSTADGLTPIGAVVLGELVWAYNEATGTTGLYTVTAVLVHNDAVLVDLTIDDEPLTTTPEHPFWTRDHGWVAAADLWLGDSIRAADGSWGIITRLALRDGPRTMYNLTVADAHTFFVGDGQ